MSRNNTFAVTQTVAVKSAVSVDQTQWCHQSLRTRSRGGDGVWLTDLFAHCLPATISQPRYRGRSRSISHPALPSKAPIVPGNPFGPECTRSPLPLPLHPFRWPNLNPPLPSSGGRSDPLARKEPSRCFQRRNFEKDSNLFVTIHVLLLSYANQKYW